MDFKVQSGGFLLAPVLPNELMHLSLSQNTFRCSDHVVEQNFERCAAVLFLSFARAEKEKHEQKRNTPKVPFHQRFSVLGWTPLLPE